MAKKRVIGGAAFGGKNLLDRRAVECVCAQTVDGFGGDAHDLTGGEQCARPFDIARRVRVQQ